MLVIFQTELGRTADLGGIRDSVRSGWTLLRWFYAARTPEEEEGAEDPGENERRDEGGRSPAVNGTLGEGQDEADERAHHDDHSGQVHSLPSRRGVGALGVARASVRKQEDCGNDEDLRVSAVSRVALAKRLTPQIQVISRKNNLCVSVRSPKWTRLLTGSSLAWPHRRVADRGRFRAHRPDRAPRASSAG